MVRWVGGGGGGQGVLGQNFIPVPVDAYGEIVLIWLLQRCLKT